MRTKTFILPAIGSTPWMHMNDKVANFDVSYAVYHSQASDAAGTIDIGMSSGMTDAMPIVLTRSGTTVTIPNALPIGEVNSHIQYSKTGDNVIVSGAGAPFDGTFPITNTAGVVTYTCANSGPTVSNPGTQVTLLHTSSTAFTGTDVGPTAIIPPFDYIRATIATMTVGAGIVFVVNQGTMH